MREYRCVVCNPSRLFPTQESLESHLGNGFHDIEDDNVNSPPHYTAYRGLEVIDLVEQMNFNRGNAVKYIARAGLKNPDSEIEDLKKAQWYITREIERLEKEK